MRFTVELSSIPLVRFRLQNDGSWRKLAAGVGLCPTDKTFRTPAEVTEASKANDPVTVGGRTYEVDPQSFEFSRSGTVLWHDSLVFRRALPPEPTIEQLREVIAAGDDSVHNSLLLTVNGKFELRQVPPFDFHLNDPSVVVRHETYGAGNNYVGEEAAQDSGHIEREFLDSLWYWTDHLTSHLTRQYCDVGTTEGLTEIRRRLQDIRDRWTPDY